MVRAVVLSGASSRRRALNDREEHMNDAQILTLAMAIILPDVDL
jgi:hypothetical protein